MFSFHAAFPRGSRRRRGRGAADGRRPRARERRKKCSDRYTCYHTTRCPLGLGYKGALPGSCTPSTPSLTRHRRVFHARINEKSTNRQGKKRVSQRSRARRRDERRGVAREARARRPSRPDAGARAVIEKRHRRRAVPARVAVVAAAARGDSRRGDERGAAALPSSIGGGDVDELLITCRPRRHLVS